MKLLSEEARYDSNLKYLYQKIYSGLKNAKNLSLADISNYLKKITNSKSLSETESNQFAISFNDLTKALPKSNIDPKIILKVASEGPDDNQNISLKYVLALTDANHWKNKDYVEYIVDQIQGDMINPTDSNNNLFPYLINLSLYNRNDRDFKYAVFALDVFYNEDKIKEFYSTKNINGDLCVLLNLPKEELDELFGTSDNSMIAGATSASRNDGNVWVKVTPAVFYDRFEVSSDINSKIIPSGVNSNSGRNIWHIVDTYSNSIEETKSKKKDTSSEEAEYQKKQKINKAVEQIKNDQMTDNLKSELIKLLNSFIED